MFFLMMSGECKLFISPVLILFFFASLLSCNPICLSTNADYTPRLTSPPSSPGSTTSSASESDSGGLHAGLCAQQSGLSENDALVARLALQLMVTCLQNRPEALGG